MYNLTLWTNDFKMNILYFHEKFTNNVAPYTLHYLYVIINYSNGSDDSSTVTSGAAHMSGHYEICLYCLGILARLKLQNLELEGKIGSKTRGGKLNDKMHQNSKFMNSGLNQYKNQ